MQWSVLGMLIHVSFPVEFESLNGGPSSSKIGSLLSCLLAYKIQNFKLTITFQFISWCMYISVVTVFIVINWVPFSNVIRHTGNTWKKIYSISLKMSSVGVVRTSFLTGFICNFYKALYASTLFSPAFKCLLKIISSIYSLHWPFQSITFP